LAPWQEYDYIIIDELWDSINHKSVSKKRKSRTGLTVWTVVAFKDGVRYIKAFAMRGHASLQQFQLLLSMLPPAKEYFTDEARWYDG
jgi:hypothetical protein